MHFATNPRTPLPPPSVAFHVRRVLVFKGLVSVVYGSMWVHYLRMFWSASNNPRQLHDGHAQQTLCRDVSPMLRSVLSVVAWVQLIMGGAVCAWHTATLWTTQFNAHRTVLLVAQLVLLAVFVYQIQFLRSVTASDKTVVQVQSMPHATRGNDCRTIASEQQEVAWAYGWIVLILGVLFVLLGLTMQSMPSK